MAQSRRPLIAALYDKLDQELQEAYRVCSQTPNANVSSSCHVKVMLAETQVSKVLMGEQNNIQSFDDGILKQSPSTALPHQQKQNCHKLAAMHQVATELAQFHLQHLPYVYSAAGFTQAEKHFFSENNYRAKLKALKDSEERCQTLTTKLPL